jgi:hypothetical protein
MSFNRHFSHHSLGSADCARTLTLALTVLLLAGCGAKPVTVERPSGPAAQPRPITVAIQFFEDEREIDDRNPRIQNIPLVIYASTRKSQFDRANRSLFGGFFTQIFAEKLKGSLDEMNAFRGVTVVRTVDQAKNHPLLIRGTIHKASREGTIITYGLSILAKYFWLLGPPKTTHHWELDVAYEVVRTIDLDPLAPETHRGVKRVVQPKRFTSESSTRTLTTYSDNSDVSEIVEAIENVSDAGAAYIMSSLPPAGTPQLASVVDSHRKWLEQQELKESIIEKLAPPSVTITLDRPDPTIRREYITADLLVNAVGGIRQVDFELNGKPIPTPELDQQLSGTTKENAQRSYVSRYRVEIPLGDNVITARVRDWYDETASRRVEIKRLPRVLAERPRTAIVVGVSRFAHPAIASSPSPGADNALRVEQFLTDEYGGQMEQRDVTALLDGEASLQAVVAQLKETIGATKNGDTVLIYMSTLSIAIDRSGPAYLLLADSDPENLELTALNINVLSEILQESLADDTLLILDSAYPVGEYELHAQGALVEMARRLRNVGVLVSTDRGDTRTAAEGTSFTEVMLDAMVAANDLDDDGALTLDEVSEGLRSASTAAGLPFPRLTGRYNRQLPLKMLE